MTILPRHITVGEPEPRSLVPEVGPKNLNIMGNTAGIRDAQWREGKLEEIVHLDDGSRLRMGKSTITYFKVLYQIIKCRASSKIAGLEIERREREGVRETKGGGRDKIEEL